MRLRWLTIVLMGLVPLAACAPVDATSSSAPALPAQRPSEPEPPALTPTALTPTLAPVSTASPEPTPPPQDHGAEEVETERTDRQPQDRDRQGCTSDPSPLLTAPITDLSKIEVILPPFVISGDRFKSRSYVSIGRDANGEFYEVPVYAPIDSKLMSITYYVEPMQNEQGEWLDVEQYSLDFQVSCEVSYGFDHLWRLAEDVAALAPTEPARSTRGDFRLATPLSMQAGELIGYTTGTIQAHNWDFVFSNSSRRNSFANQERYEYTGDLGNLLIGDCPYDYYDEEVRGAYYALLDGLDAMSEGGGCLRHRDVPGTIAGGWFSEPFVKESVVGPEPGWALAVGTSSDEQVRVNAEGRSLRVNAGQPTYVDPKLVTSEHCYEQRPNPTAPPSAFVYLKLLSDAELALAFGDGSCPQQLPAGHQTYHR